MDYREPQFYRLAAAARRADRDVIDLVSGDPDWAAPAGIAEGLERYAATGKDDPATFQYPPTEGLQELRSAIASRRNVDRDGVLVTHGATEGIALGLASALDDGSEVVLTDPTYPYYPGLIRELGGQPRFVETGPSGDLDPAALRAAAGPDTAAVLINTPNNPTGAVYDRETLSAIGDIAVEYDALLISDETYDHFVLQGEFASALTLPERHRLLVGSFSKTFAITGFRVGYALVGPDRRDALRTRHMLTTVTGSRPAQAAVVRALETTDPRYFREGRDRLRDRSAQFAERLEAAGATVQIPDGGFYVLVKLPGFEGSMATAESLIENVGVAGMPGETFGGLEGWFRFALVSPRVETAADRLAAAVA